MLNAGVDALDIAERAGNSAEVIHRVYGHRTAGRDQINNGKVDAFLKEHGVCMESLRHASDTDCVAQRLRVTQRVIQRWIRKRPSMQVEGCFGFAAVCPGAIRTRAPASGGRCSIP